MDSCNSEKNLKPGPSLAGRQTRDALAAGAGSDSEPGCRALRPLKCLICPVAGGPAIRGIYVVQLSRICRLGRRPLRRTVTRTRTVTVPLAFRLGDSRPQAGTGTEARARTLYLNSRPVTVTVTLGYLAFPAAELSLRL
jgi:hypothetical protein